MKRLSQPAPTTSQAPDRATSVDRHVGILAALARLLARQAAREFLEHAGTDGAPSEFIDKDGT